MRGRLDAFDRLVAHLDYPMHVVTAAAAGERSGCLVGFATQCSIEPPRYLVCLSKANHTFPVADRAAVLAVHFLGPEHCELARLFGEETGDEVDKFARCDWHPGPAGTPLLAGCPWVAGPVVGRFDTGDHVAYVLDVDGGQAGVAGVAGDWRPLSFQEVRGLDPGHPPGDRARPGYLT